MADRTNEHNFVLTGVQRSGTTLACYLLNKLPQAVALNEPIRQHLLANLPPAQLNDAVEAFFDDQRHMILGSGKARSRATNGKLPTNTHGAVDPTTGRRAQLVNSQFITVDKPLNPDFRLIIKHPALFTALLKHLVNRFPCYAIVRNPLAILQSWTVTDMPAATGHVPVGEAFDPVLKRRLAAEADLLNRQLLLLSWFFESFLRYVPATTVKYEDIIATGGRTLAALDKAADSLSESLRSQNRNPLYGDAMRERLAERLVKSDGAYWQIYSRADVEALLTERRY